MLETNIVIPGKTFLVGEYVATVKGPSLIFTSKPKFSLKVIKTNANQEQPFHPDSPAGKLYQLHAKVLQKHSFKFNNPYAQGGLGGSTAEFLALYLYIEKLLDLDKVTDHDLVKFYQSLSITKGTPPSGADLIAQRHQGISYYYPDKKIQQSHNWPFQDLSLLLFHTKQKLATHEHLKNLKNNNNFSELATLAHLTYESFRNASTADFINGIILYGKQLQSQNLVAQHTQLILSNVTKLHPEVLASKGCGALGADVFMVLCHPSHKEQLINSISQQGYPLMATEQQLANII